MKSLRSLTAVLPFVFLASCASKFTPAQREALSTVAIAPTVVKSDAYAEPYGGDRQGAANAAQAGASSGTGALGGIVGSLVGESIAATQNNMFRGKKKNLFGAIQTNTPQVGPMLNTRLGEGLKNDPFFKSRIRATSPNSITSTVTSYQLVRMGKDKDELLFTPQITVFISLKDGSGKSLVDGSYTGTGYQNPIEVYSNSAAKSKEGYDQAAKMAVDQFIALLAKKTAE